MQVQHAASHLSAASPRPPYRRIGAMPERDAVLALLGMESLLGYGMALTPHGGVSRRFPAFPSCRPRHAGSKQPALSCFPIMLT